MSHICKRKDIVFVNSKMDVIFVDELDKQDEIKDQEKIVAAQENGETIEQIEQGRAEVIERLIESNKQPIKSAPKTKRVIKR